MKLRLLIGSCFAMVLLTACSENPLNKISADEAARLVINACTDAMEEQGFHESGISARYAQCMEQRANASFNCDALYHMMAIKLIEQGISISSTQVQDHKVYARIKDELQQRAYFSR
ncbi:putative periplasmic lipoprotein [Legionella saoudiensis]|uniref:hypothetical protein n=1 Tax=Legionella saoudiensis TaxID=1750561 RepID=UPI000731B23D|nr:hypothetical protein [Legionella saoudiensis]